MICSEPAYYGTVMSEPNDTPVGPAQKTLRLRSISHLARHIAVPEDKLVEIATTVASYYVEFSRCVKGKERVLVMAKKPLSLIQRRILDVLLMRLPQFEASFGAAKGRSIRDNATVHANAKYIAKLDVHSFYPSIHRTKVYNFFRIAQDCSPDVARLLTLLTTRKHCLPLGTSTSPMLADQIVRPIDKRIAGMAAKLGLRYTRYVDDITLSGGFPLKRFCHLVDSVLRQSGLRAKSSKTIVYGPGTDPGERLVTGVAIVDGRITAPKDYVSELEDTLRRAFEQSRHQQPIGGFESREHYRGQLAYVRWLDPEIGSRLIRLYRNVKWRHLEWAMQQPKKRVEPPRSGDDAAGVPPTSDHVSS